MYRRGITVTEGFQAYAASIITGLLNSTLHKSRSRSQMALGLVALFHTWSLQNPSFQKSPDWKKKKKSPIISLPKIQMYNNEKKNAVNPLAKIHCHENHSKPRHLKPIKSSVTASTSPKRANSHRSSPKFSSQNPLLYKQFHKSTTSKEIQTGEKKSKRIQKENTKTRKKKKREFLRFPPETK